MYCLHPLPRKWLLVTRHCDDVIPITLQMVASNVLSTPITSQMVASNMLFYDLTFGCELLSCDWLLVTRHYNDVIPVILRLVASNVLFTPIILRPVVSNPSSQ